MSKPDFYSLEEVACRLRIPMTAARRLAHENAFPGGIRIGKRTFRYRSEIIDRWLTLEYQSKWEKGDHV